MAVTFPRTTFFTKATCLIAMKRMYLLSSQSIVFHQLGGVVLDKDLNLVGPINLTLLVCLSKKLCLLCFNGRQAGKVTRIGIGEEGI